MHTQTSDPIKTLFFTKKKLGLTWNRTDMTAPQTSLPTINCSPSIASI